MCFSVDHPNRESFAMYKNTIKFVYMNEYQNVIGY